MKKASLLLLCGLAACQGMDADVDVDETDDAIIGGVEDPGDPAVMAVAAVGADGRGALCTSTLISPTVLLLAAHCVFPSLIPANPTFIALRGTKIIGDGATPVRLPVKSVHYDPLFSPLNLAGGHDIAVAILQSPITDATPIAINRAALAQSLVGKQVRIVGYGNNNGGFPPFIPGTGAGTKRQAMTRINGVTPILVNIGTFFTGTCQGDSGGPAFYRFPDGVERVVGVTSFGINGCRLGGSDTRVDAYQPFIDTYLR